MGPRSWVPWFRGPRSQGTGPTFTQYHFWAILLLRFSLLIYSWKFFEKKYMYFICKIFFKFLSSGKWRLFWGKLETKIKLKILWIFLFVCLFVFFFFFFNFCLRFEFAPGSTISHYSKQQKTSSAFANSSRQPVKLICLV